MAIGGGIKFFKKSKNIDATASAPVSGDASVASLLDSNSETFYRSSGTTDSRTEEIEITFTESKTIDRLFLRDFNGKDFNVMYDVGGVWTHFSSVIDIDGSQANITETAFSESTYYAEFASVSTTKIRIQILKTQVANEEKYINQVIVTEEMGTFVGYPEVKNTVLDRSLRSKKTISGKYSIQKSIEAFRTYIKFKNYPTSATYNIDLDLAIDLHDSEDPFLVWLCGGKFGTSKFNYAIPGFRLKDVYQVQVSNSYKFNYVNNIYVNPVNLASMKLVEHI